MKLSLSDYSVNHYVTRGTSQREALSALRACGFTHVDLEIREAYLEGDLEENARQLRALLADVDLIASMAHAPSVNPSKRRREATDSAVKTLRFCQIVGIPVLVIHPGAIRGNTREEFFDCNVSFFQSLIPYAEETGVTVAIENIGNYDDPYFLWNGADLREMVDRVGHTMVGACWDIGHANHFYPKDCDPYRSIVALGEKLVAIHAHDNCGYIADTYRHSRMDLHTLPYFSTAPSVNWDAVLQGLSDVGYKGTFNFEVVAGNRSGCDPFECRGETQSRLEHPSLRVWQAVNTALYEIGREMLERYDAFEC